jgi:hypothetical protein
MVRGRSPGRGLLAALLGFACADERPVFRPFLDVPPESSTAYPYADLDEITLEIARMGDSRALVSATIARGAPLLLREVPFGEDLVVHLTGRAGGLDVAYGRTCAVAVLAAEPPPQPHLLFSRILRWAPGLQPVEPARIGGLAYTLPDGSALFVGGGAAIDTIERFDPNRGAFVRVTPGRAAARTGAVLAAFPDGRALVVGGLNARGDAVTFVELIDPLAAPARQVLERSGPPLVGHAAVTLAGGAAVLVAGGRSQMRPGDPLDVTGAAWLFTFGEGGDLDGPRQLAATLFRPRAGHTLTRLGDEAGADVLVAGGEDATGNPLAQAELYRAFGGTFEEVAGATLLQPRRDHVAVRLAGGYVLVAGGVRSDPASGSDVPVAQLELYDRFQGTFIDAGLLPPEAGLTELSAIPLADGRVLLAGGRDVAGAPVATVLLARLDPVTRRIELAPTDNLAAPRAGHSAALLCDGSVLVIGGTDDSSAPLGAERYNPSPTGRR